MWWDGELFTGAPRWEKLLAAKPPQLSAEEQAFLDGPCEELCRMLDDWNITHERGDLPPQVWEFLKSRGFFAMIIPKKYGGLEFSAYAHSCVLAKIASRSATASSTVAVPNSLGTRGAAATTTAPRSRRTTTCRASRAARKSRASRSPVRVRAPMPARFPIPASCAAACYQGREVFGLRLNFSKRYITLAPVATVIGLAFRMFDPEKLLGEKTDIGITCALIPRNTPGVTIGRRHFPLNIPFQNGPDPGQGRVRAARLPSSAGRRWPAAAGACWSSSSRSGAASRCPPTPPAARRRPCGRPAPTRASAPVQHAGGQVRGRRDGDRAHGGTHLHHGCGTLGHRRRHRRRRAPVGALGHSEVPRHRDGPPRGQRRHGRARRQGHLPGSEQLSRAAATRSCRWRSRSRVPIFSPATSSSSVRARSAAIRSCCAR